MNCTCLLQPTDLQFAGSNNLVMELSESITMSVGVNMIDSLITAKLLLQEQSRRLRRSVHPVYSHVACLSALPNHLQPRDGREITIFLLDDGSL